MVCLNIGYYPFYCLKTIQSSPARYDVKHILTFVKGSFGTFPRIVRDELRKFQDACEERPDVFIRYEYTDRLDESRHKMAEYLNVDVDEVVCKLTFAAFLLSFRCANHISKMFS
jgi:hypothetical protein